jgi:hypothetical protein
MALIRWEPVTELNTIQNEMNRLFNTFFDQPAPTGRGGAPSRRWTAACSRSESPNPNRKSPGKYRSPLAPAQPTTPRRSRAPTPATGKSTAATRSQHPPDLNCHPGTSL